MRAATERLRTSVWVKKIEPRRCDRAAKARWPSTFASKRCAAGCRRRRWRRLRSWRGSLGSENGVSPASFRRRRGASGGSPSRVCRDAWVPEHATTPQLRCGATRACLGLSVGCFRSDAEFFDDGLPPMSVSTNGARNAAVSSSVSPSRCSREAHGLPRGHFSARQAGGATLATLGASAYRVSRTPSDIARTPRDALVIGFQIAGPGWCETRAGTGFTPEGGMAVGHSDSPYAATPSTEADFLCRFITVPTALIGEHADHWRSAAQNGRGQGARPPHGGNGRCPLRRPAQPAGEVCRRGRARHGAACPRRQWHAERRGAGQSTSHAHGLRHAALRIMRRQFHRHDLTPDLVAKGSASRCGNSTSSSSDRPQRFSDPDGHPDRGGLQAAVNGAGGSHRHRRFRLRLRQSGDLLPRLPPRNRRHASDFR